VCSTTRAVTAAAHRLQETDVDKDGAERRADDWLERARSVYEAHGKVFRTLWVAVGVIIVAAGLAMIVFPGPVTIVVPAGLIMLAAAFGWARTLLLRSVRKGVDAQQAVAEASIWTKALLFIGSACIAAAVIAAFILT
jgi:hypothetical protein